MDTSTLILSAIWLSNKPFPTMQDPSSRTGKIFHRYYSGPAQYLGWMDLVLLKKIIKDHNVNHIILQDLDTLGKIAQYTKIINVCKAYESKRYVFNTLDEKKQFYQDLKKNPYKNCDPIYEDAVYGGWNSSEEGNKLNIHAQTYIRYLLVHTRVDSITYMTNQFKHTASFDSLGQVIFETEPNE